MTGEAWAAIIAALITAIGTLIATKFDEIVKTLRKTPIDVSGDWEVISERVADDSWIGGYDLRLKQSGMKVTGEMRAIKVKEGRELHNYSWSCKLLNEYLIYECVCTTSSTFMISSGMLYVHPDGQGMSGHFVANSGSVRHEPTWVGKSRVKRKK
jgi:hypothetical protein